MIRQSLRSNQCMFTICRKSKSKDSRMSGGFTWVCICIMEGGHFSFLDADANPELTWLALMMFSYCSHNNTTTLRHLSC